MTMTPGQKFKLICVIVYAAIVGIITLVASFRIAPVAHTKATNPIAQNQRISEADLRSIDVDKIRGGYARRSFVPGDSITPEDVAATPSFPPTEAFAAALVVPRDRVDGGELQLCLDGKAFGQPAKVVASTCDEKTCLVTIPIKPWPKSADAITEKSHLSIAPPGADCGVGAPSEQKSE
jgi:hypothetical protein